MVLGTRFFAFSFQPTRDAAAPRAMDNNKTRGPRPFLKWVGGKTQLLPALLARLPRDFASTVKVYAEPFVGGGALLFHLLAQGLRPERVVVNDSNQDLANAYRVIQSQVPELLDALAQFQEEYRLKSDEESRRAFYLAVRMDYNCGVADRVENPVRRTAQMLFLNRTCFNGLYRVNAKGSFNVPFGRYANPRICDAGTLIADSMALRGVEIMDGDFSSALSGADASWFVYFDPPYRPISTTSSFCDYTQGGFDDSEQRRLAEICCELDAKGARWLLSNSDPRGANPNDTFFDDLYGGFDVRHVQALRMINANPVRRGKLSELLISNYRMGGLP